MNTIYDFPPKESSNSLLTCLVVGVIMGVVVCISKEENTYE